MKKQYIALVLIICSTLSLLPADNNATFNKKIITIIRTDMQQPIYKQILQILGEAKNKNPRFRPDNETLKWLMLRASRLNPEKDLDYALLIDIHNILNLLIWEGASVNDGNFKLALKALNQRYLVNKDILQSLKSNLRDRI